MTWSIRYERRAERVLDRLDATVRRRILGAIDILADDPRSATNVKALVGTDLFRLRVGDWRVVYELHDDVLLVLVIEIGHRREIYRH